MEERAPLVSTEGSHCLSFAPFNVLVGELGDGGVLDCETMGVCEAEREKEGLRDECRRMAGSTSTGGAMDEEVLLA